MGKKKMKKIHLCAWCIEEIRGHGDKVRVGEEIDCHDYYLEHGKSVVCDWCECDDEAVYECFV